MPDDDRTATHRFQPPKGTRDFYPADMAVRRYIESAWRDVSVNHGFDEIEGPTFEHLDLYTQKSGQEIVSQLFRFRREGGDVDYALRPEFTPTLARMYAAKASTLPSPTKWFCIPSHFRAERPQRGRLREFVQWNVDMIGDVSPQADAEVIAAGVGALRRLGLSGRDVTIRISHRDLIAEALRESGVADDRIERGMMLLDRREKLEEKLFAEQCDEIGLDFKKYQELVEAVRNRVNEAVGEVESGAPPESISDDQDGSGSIGQLLQLIAELQMRGVLKWCEFDPGVVRGLAYYTGIVFEIHEAAGRERAIAGGGRYDNLIELFGGPPTPAVGFAMGDVVLRLVLEDKGLLPPGEELMPRPDVFIISNGDEMAEKKLPELITTLRNEGLHVRQSYRTTRNVGKLLGEADRQRARCAIILGEELQRHHVVVKNLESGEQREVSLDDLEETIERVFDLQSG